MRLTHKILTACVFLLNFCFFNYAYASGMRFGFINPSFGGSPFNASFLTSMADKQNQNQKVTTKEDPNSIGAVKKQLESQLLSTTVGKISKLVTDSDNPLSQDVTYNVNGLTIDIIVINEATGQYQIIISDGTSSTTIDVFRNI